MTFTYDTTTSLGQVRLIIGDADENNVIFQDAEIEAFLDLNEDSVKRAAAAALDTMASSQAMILKVITVLDLRTDGAAVARALREHAARLRTEAEESEAADGDLFDWAEPAETVFQQREIVVKKALRDQ